MADVFAKSFSLKGRLLFAGLSLLFYLVANASWLYSLRLHSSLTIGANIFSISTGVCAVFIGVGIYGETITMKQIIGVVLGMVSLLLLW